MCIISKEGKHGSDMPRTRKSSILLGAIGSPCAICDSIFFPRIVSLERVATSAGVGPWNGDVSFGATWYAYLPSGASGSGRSARWDMSLRDCTLRLSASHTSEHGDGTHELGESAHRGGCGGGGDQMGRGGRGMGGSRDSEGRDIYVMVV